MSDLSSSPAVQRFDDDDPLDSPKIADHTLERRIGRGSYGEVWLGRGMTGSWRAIKIIRQCNEESSGFQRELAGIRKFEPVSRCAAGLMHILQVGPDQGRGYFYYVMELADDGHSDEPWSFNHPTALCGEIDPESYVPRTLSLEKRRRGRLPAAECLQIALALSEGLENLHKQGLVHRDLKPSNIIFVQGQAKLADIGLVAEMSEANSYVGTEGYIAPEGPNSPQGDIYSLGKVLYEISTGKDRQDFPEPMTIVEKSEHETLQELNAIVLKAAHPDLSARYKTAAEMRRDLLLIHGGKSIRAWRATRQRIKWMAGAATAISLLALVATAFDRLLEFRIRLMQGQSTLIAPALISKIPARDLSAPDETIDLSAYYTAPLCEVWYPGPKENTLASLPRGIQKLDNTRFDIRGLVQLSGGEISTYQQVERYPRQMRGIPIDRWAKRLRFLEGTVAEVSDGREIGRYRVEFASGRTAEIPIIYGTDVRALWQPIESSGMATNSTVVWTGQNPATRERNLALRLYEHVWENPRPNDQIVHLDFRTAMANSAPFLVALTCDKHEPPANEKQLPTDLITALQKQAGSFQEIETKLPPDSAALKPYKLNEHGIKIGENYFDGFRFTAPAHPAMDLAWGFLGSTNLHYRSWQLLPTQGRIKVGFEDWYHGISDSNQTKSRGTELRLQFLAGKKLQPGKEYFIWFEFGDSAPVDVDVILSFAPPGEINPNQPETLTHSLGLEKLTSANHMKFHHHYCLGAVR